MIPKAAATAPPDDLELARAVAQRDARAFETLMRRHNRMLYRTARAILGNDADAEDAVQDAYIAAFRNIARFHGGSKLSTWLTRIVINEAYQRLRKQKHFANVVPLDAYERGEETEMADTTTESPEAAAMRAELRRMLERKIDELPAQFRVVYMLREVEEMTVEETAECLDVQPETVRSRAFRARALLRESMAKEIDVASADAFGFAGERCDRIVANVLAHLHLTAERR